jgi:uncharacterized SAM-binding protein YcdF (DUF218 family)
VFFLKKLIKSMVLPPGALVVLTAGWGIWRLAHRRRSGYALLAGALLLYLLSIAAAADRMLGLVEVQTWDAAAVARADVIVLLGGGLVEGVPDFSGRSTLAPDSLGRVVDASRLHARQPRPIIFTGGSVAGGAPEAPVARRLLMDLGVPAQDIILEDASRDTAENAAYVRRLMDRHGFRRAVLVTSGYHLPRALHLFRRTGIDCTAYPANLQAERKSRLTYMDFLPNANDFRKSVIALTELLGLAFYRWIA